MPTLLMHVRSQPILYIYGVAILAVNQFAVVVVKDFNVVIMCRRSTPESSGTLFKSITAISSARLADLDVYLK